MKCSEPRWKCENACKKIFKCGNRCEIICHESSECGECPKCAKRYCPCGKTTSQRPCSEEIPTCKNDCDKPLNCNIHSCSSRCHYGPCEVCRQIVKKRCRCGQFEKSLPCSAEFKCETKCNKLRNCGKHKCNRKCCDGDCRPCNEICNKMLSCKNHKCMNLKTQYE